MKFGIKAVWAVVMTAAVLAAAPAGAEEERLWLRYPAVSPDGRHIAFTHRGQIYRVDAQTGGTAVPVTAQGHYSHGPVWAPDSGEIAFASDVNGDDDVYVTDTATGHLRRLTWSSNGEVPTSFTPDGTGILFTSGGLGDPVRSLQTPLNGNPHLYRIELATGEKQLVLPNQAHQAVWNSDGTRLLYSYNPSVDPLSRQHRVATNARQVWLYDAQSGEHTRLLNPAFDAINPVWGPDESSIYYLGEASGTLNVWRHDLKTGEDRQITRFDVTPARYLSISDDGDIVFARGGALHRIAAGSDAPQELAVTIPEQRMDLRQRQKLTSTEDFVSSPDGAYHAVVANAEIYLLDRAGNHRQLTDTDEPEKDVAFSPDGGLLVYAALRDGLWGIYGVDLQRGQVGEQLALSYVEVALVTGEENAYQPSFSPDGSKLAYVADRREIKVLDLDTGETVMLFDAEDYNTTYSDTDLWMSWSPDSRHLVVPWKRVPFDDVDAAGIVPADGSAPIRPLTQDILNVADAAWSADGTQIVALTPMYALRTLDRLTPFGDFYRVFMSDEARGDFLATQEGTFGEPRETADADTSSEEETQWPGYAFQPERRSYLEGRLTTESAIHLSWHPLDEGPYMVSVAIDMGMNFSVVLLDLTSGAMQELASLEGVQIEGVSYVPALRALDIKTADSVITIPLLQPDQRTVTPFAVEHVLDAEAKRAAAFEQVWSDIKHKFYRADVEGRDWERIGRHYRAFLGSIASDRELAHLIEEMFGELSASHLFVMHLPSKQGEALHTQTAALGFYTDYAYQGAGVRISAVLPGGPLDRQVLQVEPGDIIASIDGKPIDVRADVDRMLDGLAGRQVVIGIVDGDGQGIERGIVARPIPLREEQELSHQRWIDTRRALVDERSRGCIAYQYVPEMNNDAYLATYGRLLASADTTKAALLDIRSNRGGNLHRQLITLLSGEPYAKVGRENRLTRMEPLDRWTKPSAVLVDTFAYSDGSIFPRAYQDLGIGTVVGDRLLNTGTGVDYVRSSLIPGLIYGIPVQPFRGMDDSYYENTDVVPDIEVPYDPNMADRGRDNQLDAAIDALMAEIGTDSDCRAPSMR